MAKLPVTYVSLNEARAYCKFIGGQRHARDRHGTAPDALRMHIRCPSNTKRCMPNFEPQLKPCA